MRRKLKTVGRTTISKNKDEPILCLKISSPVHISHSTVAIPFTTEIFCVRYSDITWTRSHLSNLYLQTSNCHLLTKKLNLPFLCSNPWQQFLCTTLRTIKCCRQLKFRTRETCTQKAIPQLLGLDEYCHLQLLSDHLNQEIFQRFACKNNCISFVITTSYKINK